VVNDLWLIVSGRPRFSDFPDVRLPPRFRVSRHQVSLASVLLTALLILVGSMFLVRAEQPEAQSFGAVLARVRADQPLVALTFDDGPSIYTAQVLDTLAEYDIKATFFLIGRNVERYPELARRELAEGHAVGNHTYSHPMWAAIEDSRHLERELEGGALAIQRATGFRPTLFRPPHGWRSPWMVQLACRDGYTVVTWSVSPDDWRRPPAQVIANRVLQQVRPGMIVLLHDGLDMRVSPPMRNTLDALPALIEGLRAKGYRLVTVPELMRLSTPPEIHAKPSLNLFGSNAAPGC
jgi:peptidoglycan/xylan/chitin deacetylase (PgdA/CDA1 family)